MVLGYATQDRRGCCFLLYGQILYLLLANNALSWEKQVLHRDSIHNVKREGIKQGWITMGTIAASWSPSI